MAKHSPKYTSVLLFRLLNPSPYPGNFPPLFKTIWRGIVWEAIHEQGPNALQAAAPRTEFLAPAPEKSVPLQRPTNTVWPKPFNTKHTALYVFNGVFLGLGAWLKFGSSPSSGFFPEIGCGHIWQGCESCWGDQRKQSVITGGGLRTAHSDLEIWQGWGKSRSMKQPFISYSFPLSCYRNPLAAHKAICQNQAIPQHRSIQFVVVSPADISLFSKRRPHSAPQPTTPAGMKGALAESKGLHLTPAPQFLLTHQG